MTKYKLKRGIAYREIAGNIYIVDSKNSLLHQLNETATFIWRCLLSGKNLEEIVHKVCLEYDVEPEIARHDVEEIVTEMINKGLVEEI
ncbi:MAG: PqqD family protein [Endomicrobia bacterium]|nr:PqqD family protein [Endomicrobiia bacterium]